jgi:hypothetical protein
MPLDMLPLPVAGGESREQESEVNAVASVRLLTPEEIASLQPIFEKEGGVIPSPEVSFVLGSVAPDGHVVTFMVVQLRLHAEPMWVEEGHEHLVRSLVHATEKMIAERVPGGCDVFLFAPAGKVAKLAANFGMRLEPWTVWSKYVKGVYPVEPIPGEVIQ